ncbi:MAG: hypothetical protein ACK5L0_00925 [Candidatus Fimivivens sp.]
MKKKTKIVVAITSLMLIVYNSEPVISPASPQIALCQRLWRRKTARKQEKKLP